MSWLLRDGDVLAAVEDRPRGLARGLPSEDIHGVVVVDGMSVLHTFSCHAPFDVARCAAAAGEDGHRVVEVRRMSRLAARRVALSQLGKGATVVAPSGSFERWHLRIGDRLEIT